MTNVLLQKIRVWFTKKGGSSISSNGPEPDFHPKPRPIGSTVELDEVPRGQLPRRPSGDGWVWDGGNWVRPIKFGKGMRTEMLEDDPPAPRSSLTSNNPFEDYRP